MNKAQKITMGITLIVMSFISIVGDDWGIGYKLAHRIFILVQYLLVVLFLGAGIFTLFGLKK